jgi:signal transduction histidine kinase
MAERSAVLPATQELIARIGWFGRLRSLAAAGVLVFVEVGRRVLPIQLDPRPVYVVVAVLAAYNLAVALTFRAMRRRWRAGRKPSAWEPAGPVARFLLPRLGPGMAYDREAGQAAIMAGAQIALDLIILAALLHFSGGVENPLRALFVLHLIISGILLSRPATYLFATFGVALYAAMVLGELSGVLPHYALYAHWRPDAYLDPRLVGTQLFLFGVLLYVAAYLGSEIELRLRWREQEVVTLARELAQKSDRVEAAYEELRAVERAKSEYMRKVAHELRGPLGTIRTALGVVLEAPSGTERPHSLDLIRRAHRRAGELAEVTQELLTLARARAQAASVAHAPLDPAVVAASVIDELKPSAEQKGVALSVSTEHAPREILGDGEGLADLMANLLSNAIRYTPAGGRVDFRMRQAGRALVIEVADTGIGIAQQDLSRIYEEFYRSPAAREAVPEGTGLGMAIVKAVVERHGGTISVESEVGKGTRFTVSIPADALTPRTT